MNINNFYKISNFKIFMTNFCSTNKKMLIIKIINHYQFKFRMLKSKKFKHKKKIFFMNKAIKINWTTIIFNKKCNRKQNSKMKNNCINGAFKTVKNKNKLISKTMRGWNKSIYNNFKKIWTLRIFFSFNFSN
jgi:hypothetical protein